MTKSKTKKLEKEEHPAVRIARKELVNLKSLTSYDDGEVLLSPYQVIEILKLIIEAK